MKKLFSILTLIVFGAVVPGIVFANGGDQRIVEGGKYFINLSRAPFTPRAGTKTAMLISIADGKTGRPVKEDLALRIRIFKLGGKGGERELLFEQKGIEVKGGILEFPYTFADSGLHEIFFDFALASEPNRIIEPPDFMMDIQKPEQAGTEKQAPLFLIAIIASFAVGWFVGMVKSSYNRKTGKLTLIETIPFKK